MRILSQHSVQETRAVSPVIAVILMVAVTVILSTAVGVLVFNLGSLTDPGANAGVSVDEEPGASYEIQLVDKQDADRVIVETDDQQHTLDTVGESVSSAPFNNDQVNIFAVKDGERTLVSSYEAFGGWAQYLGTGSDNSVTITGTTTVNSYSYLPESTEAGTETIPVNDGTKFAAGDEILLIQMQNSSGGEAGAYEVHTVADVSGDTLTVEDEVTTAFASGEFTTRSEPIPANNPGTVTQVVRVPHYTDLTIDGGTITAPEWDGRTGGIVFFRASGTVEFINGGKINVTGAGFRGGTCGDCTDDWDGGRGEGINGWHYGGGEQHYADEVSLNNANGGGGNHVDDNDGGDPAAGGGHAGAGEDSNRDQQSSYAKSHGGVGVGLENLRQLHFGGGGGAGADNDGYTPYPEDSHGGGIAIVSAETIKNPHITANGIDGVENSTDWTAAGVSGGGAGGTVYLSADTIDGGAIEAEGGTGAYNNDDESGAGAPGRIRLDANTVTADFSPTPYEDGFTEYEK